MTFSVITLLVLGLAALTAATDPVQTPTAGSAAERQEVFEHMDTFFAGALAQSQDPTAIVTFFSPTIIGNFFGETVRGWAGLGDIFQRGRGRVYWYEVQKNTIQVTGLSANGAVRAMENYFGVNQTIYDTFIMNKNLGHWQFEVMTQVVERFPDEQNVKVGSE